MKHIFTHLAFLCLFGSISVRVSAQQDPHFSQYMHNKLFMNPAYAGMKHGICVSLIARQQWAGFDGAPKSGVLSGDVYLEKLSGGLGFNLMYDKLGFEQNAAYQLDYSFHRDRIFGGTLGIGISLGAVTKVLGPTGSQSWISTTSWITDPSVPPQLKSTNFDCGFGLWYEHDKLWFGISSSHINGGQFNDGTTVLNNNNTPVTHDLIYNISRHYWITGGYNHHMRTWTLKPSFSVKTDAVVTSVDINCIASMNNGFWFGGSWRVKDAVSPMIGFEWLQSMKDKKRSNFSDLNPDYHDDLKPAKGKYSTCRIGFAYDYTTSKLNNYNNGTFEIFLNYCLPWEPATGGGKDVRNFR